MLSEWLGMGLDVAALYTAAAFAAFLVASTVGIGGPLILIPILLSELSPAAAVAIVAPVMLFNNMAKLGLYRGHIRLGPALTMAASALPAAVFASLFTGVVEGRVLRLIIALFIVLAVAVPWLARRELHVGRRGLVGWGAIVGAVAGFSGTAGPPMALAMKGHGLAGFPFVATVAVVQLALQTVRVPTYLTTGVFPIELWPLASIMSLAAAVSVLAARPLLRHLNPKRFRYLLDGFLLLIATYLTLGTVFH
ncbi:MAG: sulfite exporter TauE/SafE family protein [Proteobacteria bacterium]|nr:sulfite exporter TauE/SafE family protein [Pseudomonadota bacterium]